MATVQETELLQKTSEYVSFVKEFLEVNTASGGNKEFVIPMKDVVVRINFLEGE